MRRQAREVSETLDIDGLGSYRASVTEALRSLESDHVLHRIWTHDYGVWKSEPTEISDRLDWLHTPAIMLEHLPPIEHLVQQVRSAGFEKVMLLGMGGSSLAPSVFADVFGKRDGYPELDVLDNTEPGTVRTAEKSLDLTKTLFVVSSKSGGTVETLSLMKYFYGRVAEAVGRRKAAEQFVVITDPGTNLSAIAEKNVFRTEILNDPNIGGRYSVISYDGLVPAALMGVDVARIVKHALRASEACETGVPLERNPGAVLGAYLGALAREGRDKMTFFISPRIASFGSWLEQLIAESTGKEGKGILPVVGESPYPIEVYGNDRAFVSIRLEGDDEPIEDGKVEELVSAGHPVVRLKIKDEYELGEQFFVWEMAVAVAGHILGINPFDQPNVESAKALARKMVERYEVSGNLPRPRPRLTTKDILVYGDVHGETPGEVLSNFLHPAQPGSYIAIQAYIQQNKETDAALGSLRSLLTRRHRLATTVGYGPRFLHSTGQLHKGDAGRGIFIQITSESPDGPRVPNELGSSDASISFGVLVEAEALGDRQALIEAGRRVVRFHIMGDVLESLDYLAEAQSGVAVSFQ